MDYIIPQSTPNKFSLSPAYGNAIDQLNTSIDALPEVFEDHRDAARAASVIATIAGIKKLIDKAHAELKKPFLDAGRELDAIKKKETAILDALKNKINDRIVAYQRAEQEKLRKAQEEAARKQAEIEDAARKERENLSPELQIAHAAATDIVVQRTAQETIAAAQATPVAGMRINRTVKILSVDIATLIKTRFDLCNVEANLIAIKKEILSGNKIPGVEYRIDETAACRAASVNATKFDY
ncbi:MAG: hypothetical protein E7037_02460 [Verrucomicrobia bacterium]|nr:hypothetical protein [Verrucomicrobiota bacterium]